MFRGAKIRCISVGVIFAFLLMGSPILLPAANDNTGNLIGFIYGTDGTTPLAGAVVKVQNINSGNVYESSVSDNAGLFRIQDIEKGIYLFGVATEDGNFNADNLFGIHANKTAKVSIALKSYDQETKAAQQEMYEYQEIKGESLIGKVNSYDQSTKVAEIFIIKGMMRKGDKVHVFADKLNNEESETNFFQEIKGIVLEGEPVKRAFAGQTVMVLMDYNVMVSDLVYVVCKQGTMPIFLTPLGIASVIAGTGTIIYGFTELTKDPPSETQFKK